MTLAQSKKQLDRLTSHLQSTTKNNKCTNKQDNEDTDYDKLEADLQSVFDQFDEEHLEDISDDDTVCANNCDQEEIFRKRLQSLLHNITWNQVEVTRRNG